MKQTKCYALKKNIGRGSHWRHLWWVPSRRGCAQQASSISSSLLAKSSTAASSLLWLLRLVLRGWRLDINALSQSLKLRWQSKQLTKSWIWKDWVSCCWSTLPTATARGATSALADRGFRAAGAGRAARWGHLFCNMIESNLVWKKLLSLFLAEATSYLSVIEPEKQWKKESEKQAKRGYKWPIRDIKKRKHEFSNSPIQSPAQRPESLSKPLFNGVSFLIYHFKKNILSLGIMQKWCPIILSHFWPPPLSHFYLL